MSLNNEARPSAELVEKLGRIAAFLNREDLQGVLLGAQRNFAWASCGGSNHVGWATQDGVAFLLFTREGGRYLLAPNNECPRIFDEEVGSLGFEPVEIPWHEIRSNPQRLKQSVAAITDPESVGVDSAVGAMRNIEPKFASLRYTLTAAETERYRVHARSVAEAVEAAAHAIEPGASEKEIEALLAFNIMQRGARPTVLLIASNDRVFRYRHPLPTDRRAGSYVMLSACARRWGLTAAVTRLVHFGPPAEEINRKYAALQRLEARLIAATRPPVRGGELMDKVAEWYAQEGFAGEWGLHHQGGATGYLEREWVIYPGSEAVVNASQAFAWNPTIAGTKVEDTILVGEDGNEILTATGEWPCDEIEAMQRPRILVR
jgi:Xaa-Pro dipeptidase